MRYLSLVLLSVLSLPVAADNDGGAYLMPCPDCGKTVSKRALMCPACGCDGKVIRGAAKALADNETGLYGMSALNIAGECALELDGCQLLAG